MSTLSEIKKMLLSEDEQVFTLGLSSLVSVEISEFTKEDMPPKYLNVKINNNQSITATIEHVKDEFKTNQLFSSPTKYYFAKNLPINEKYINGCYERNGKICFGHAFKY